MAISEQNLELIPDYEQRIEVLQELKFIDENSTVLLKGRVACEVRVIHSVRRPSSSQPRCSVDQFCKRACPHRAHSREYPRFIRTRRSSSPLIMFRIPRENRRRTRDSTPTPRRQRRHPRHRRPRRASPIETQSPRRGLPQTKIRAYRSRV